MRKILPFAIFLFVIASAFGRDKIEIKVFETSNDFAEIKEAFQKRLYHASSEYKFFYHLVVSPPFDIDGELFDRKAKIAIRKNKYFIAEIAYGGDLGPGIILVNKENLKAVVFHFNYEEFEGVILSLLSFPCSKTEIDKALALYPDL
jgi:hypothetical protein